MIILFSHLDYILDIWNLEMKGSRIESMHLKYWPWILDPYEDKSQCYTMNLQLAANDLMFLMLPHK